MAEENKTIRVQLNFPLEQVKTPIIWHLAHDFNLKFSIRRAAIDAHTGGFTVLEVSGPREKIAGMTVNKDAGLARLYNLERAKFLKGLVDRIAGIAPDFGDEIGFSR